jgi:hypothetical protein
MSKQLEVNERLPIVASFSIGHWLTIISVAGGSLLGVYTMLNDAKAKADQALELARSAVSDAAKTQAQLDNSLRDLAGRLGRIEGLLEAMRSERDKSRT